MADRYQNRAFPSGNDYDRSTGSPAPTESDPLAELARLIGQTDPFGARPMSRANLPAAQTPDHEPSYDTYADEAEHDDVPPPSPPSWMRRATRHETPLPPQEDYPAAVHPLQRYPASQPVAEPDYQPQTSFAAPGHQPDSARYDDALFGGFDHGVQQPQQHDQQYADDGYAYEGDDQQYDEPQQSRRRSGMITVAAVLALAVFGVGGAFAYRTYTGKGHSGEPPIIRADAGPTKVVPAPADGATKVPDRMATGDGAEKMVSREETPIDPSAKTGPRVVFPPLTPNGNAPMPSSVVPGASNNGVNGTFSNNEPHRVRTTPVRGDQADAGSPANVPPAAPAKPRATTRAPAPSSTGSNANAPLSLSPRSEDTTAPEPQRVASIAPTQIAPPSTPSAGAASGGYLVSVTSQPSPAEAQASYRSMQGKYAGVLGSQSPVVVPHLNKDGKTNYRAGLAFNTSGEATQFCQKYSAAGGQCWVVKN
jgi:hypothetical protein